MKIKVLGKRESIVAYRIFGGCGFNDYRTYRALREDLLKKYLSVNFADSLRGNGASVFTAESSGRALGMAGVFMLPWDSRHFGLKMARLDHLLAPGGYRSSLRVKEGLLSELLERCRRSGIVFLSCRADTADISSVHSLEKNGFLLMDTIVTYAFNRRRHRIPVLKDMYKVLPAVKKDLTSLVNIAGEAFSRDRFHLDPHIPPAKADSLFEKWIKNSLNSSSSQKVFVSRKGGAACGFLSFELNKKLEGVSGLRIAGHGLSAVSPRAKGAYISLVKAAIEEISRNYDFLEFDTQLNNHEVIKVWQRFGFDFIRSKYTFHKWIGG